MSQEDIDKFFSGQGNGRWYKWLFPANFFNMPASQPYRHTCGKIYHACCMAGVKHNEEMGYVPCPLCTKEVKEVFTHKAFYDATIQKIRIVVLIIFTFIAGVIGSKLFNGSGLGVAGSMLLGYYLTNQAMKEPLFHTVLYPGKVIFNYAYCWAYEITKKDIE